MTDSAEVTRARAAVQWFASQGISTIRVHYPKTLPQTTPLGACSCGKAYKMGPDGKPVDAPGLCLAPGKHPAERDWNRGRLASAGDWDAPWNVGLMCGREYGLLVLDVDVRNGGLDTMSKLAPWVQDGPHHWELGDTFSYFTSGHNGSRGYHLLYKPTADAWDALASLKSPHGIDFKMSGMVVAVPSLHASGARYEFKDEVAKAIRVLSEDDALQLVGALKSMAGESPETAASAPSMGPGDATETLKQWLLGLDVGAVGEGERNNAMLPLVGALCRLSMDGSTTSMNAGWLKRTHEELTHDHAAVPEGVWAVAAALNQSLCRPPMPAEELGTMVHNVFRSEVEKQMGALRGVESMRARAPETQEIHRMEMGEDLKSAIRDSL